MTEKQKVSVAVDFLISHDKEMREKEKQQYHKIEVGCVINHLEREAVRLERSKEELYWIRDLRKAFGINETVYSLFCTYPPKIKEV